MNFIDKMDEMINAYSFTENGAIAYKSSGKKLTDFNFKISYYRENPKEIEVDFEQLLNGPESLENIARYIFYIGDIREGLGERQTFRTCLQKFLKSLDDEKANKLLNLVAEYNRWDSLWEVSIDDERLFNLASLIINNQLMSDINNFANKKPISLLAKWLPSENASSKKTKEKARKIRKVLNLSPRGYRVILSHLRKHIDVTERKMSQNQWSEIDYEKVPSKANLIYSGAFLRHDEERRDKYLASLKKGEAKINSSVVYPYEIIDKYCGNYGWFYRDFSEYNEVYEQMWKALPKLNIKNTLVVRDGSGSMLSRVANTSPLSVATSLAIYLSENNSDEWKNRFITFSSNPRIIDLSDCENLYEKINKIYNFDECSNTDIYKTMKLVLNTAKENNLTQDQMPEMIIIISDMQFDGAYFNMNGSLFDNIKREFECAGYNLPKICFWNVDGDISGTIPLRENEYGLVLCSGFSINIVKMFLSGEVDPYKVLIDTINSKRYDPVGEVFSKN